MGFTCVEQFGVAGTCVCQTEILPLFHILGNKGRLAVLARYTRISFFPIGISNPLFHYLALQTAMVHRTAIFFTTHSPIPFILYPLIDVMPFPGGILLASSIGSKPSRPFIRWARSFLLSLLTPSIKLAFIQSSVNVALLFLHNGLERLNMFLHQLSPKVL